MEATPVPLNPPRSTQLFRRLFTWRNARRLSVTVAVLATLMAVFYAEENWRGRRAWEQCKSELAGRGIQLDWSACLPKPVADDQNIFAVLKMKGWFIRDYTNSPGLYQRMNSTNNNPWLVAEFTPEKAKDYLAWGEQFQPDFDVMRDALKRPYARMEGDYELPFSIPLPNFSAMRTVAQLLAKRTQCYLILGKPEEALKELTLLHDLCRMLDYRVTGLPVTLVSAMINVAITGLYTQVIADGIQMHAWLDPELVAIQGQLQDINLPLTVDMGFCCEPAALSRVLATYSRKQLAGILPPGQDEGFWRSNYKTAYLSIKYGPRGWLYQNMVAIASLDCPAADCWDASNGQIDPGKAHTAVQQSENLLRGPYTFFALLAIPNYTKAWRSTAYNQSSVRLALITCALERHRLATGQYPASLGALVPQYLEKIPTDLIGGQPLHYRVTDNGKFALYSVGWNETDDGGQVVMGRDNNPDMSKGDWALISRLQK